MNLSYCPSLHVDICLHLCAVKFEKLQKLDISDSDAGDSCLQMLGMYCKDLRYKCILIKDFLH